MQIIYFVRTHKVQDHNNKETKDNIIIGFQNDSTELVNVLKAMEDEIYVSSVQSVTSKLTIKQQKIIIHTYNMHHLS